MKGLTIRSEPDKPLNMREHPFGKNLTKLVRPIHLPVVFGEKHKRNPCAQNSFPTKIGFYNFLGLDLLF